jgi:hypothetical protein
MHPMNFRLLEGKIRPVVTFDTRPVSCRYRNRRTEFAIANAGANFYFWADWDDVRMIFCGR